MSTKEMDINTIYKIVAAGAIGLVTLGVTVLCCLKDSNEQKENHKKEEEINKQQTEPANNNENEINDKKEEIKISTDDIIIDINDNYIDSESKNETNMEISDE